MTPQFLVNLPTFFLQCTCIHSKNIFPVPFKLPSAQGQIQCLEKVQMSYLNKIAGFSQLNYWQQLSSLQLYSVQRRRERYIVIYIWKVLEKLVPNFGITVMNSPKNGHYCLVPHIRASAPDRIQNIRFNSLPVNGPRILNTLPLEIRNFSGCSVDAFKRAVDHYLQSVPDEPRVGKLIPYCSKISNSF